MTETSDSGNYSQYEDREGSSENTSSETYKQSSIISHSYQISSDNEEDDSDDSDYDDSEKIDQTSVYSWVIIIILS